MKEIFYAPIRLLTVIILTLQFGCATVGTYHTDSGEYTLELTVQAGKTRQWFADTWQWLQFWKDSDDGEVLDESDMLPLDSE